MTEFLLLLGVLLLVAANGFFVAAEFALVRARESRVEQLRDEGRRRAALVLEQIEDRAAQQHRVARVGWEGGTAALA